MWGQIGTLHLELVVALVPEHAKVRIPPKLFFELTFNSARSPSYDKETSKVISFVCWSFTFFVAATMAVNTRLHNAPIVLDNGSGTIRAGFAGEDLPKCYFPSYVGRPKHVRAMAGAREGDVFIGPMAQDLRGLLKINYPLEHGIVTDWDDMERIWQYVYQEGLKTLSEDHPVLLTEPPLNPRSNRENAAQILFETFNVPALYNSVQAVLSLYASGRTTGIVLDVGDGVAHAVPVYDGFAIPNSIRRIDVAGRDVTEYLQTQLRKAGYIFHTSAEKEIVREIKEKRSYIALDPNKEEKEWSGTSSKASSKEVDYVLPDGKTIKVRYTHFYATVWPCD